MLLYLTTIPVIYSIIIHTLSMIHHILFVYILLTSNFIFITFFIDYTYMLLFLSLSVNFGQFLYPRHQGIIMSYVFASLSLYVYSATLSTVSFPLSSTPSPTRYSHLLYFLSFPAFLPFFQIGPTPKPPSFLYSDVKYGTHVLVTVSLHPLFIFISHPMLPTPIFPLHLLSSIPYTTYSFPPDRRS